ncbi:hypothetical protein GIB67_010119 [Kingdonia uniflora]|uniref:NADPH:adrenodoxin oxidoreductase, mitochondrial n=1 Tax=Kingdonia uniflora TaxID=39325 RepID=A0A7J7NA46_9MAGN|nr:hypothetical protein GIB67_010119 [Kingdonia uniflora]
MFKEELKNSRIQRRVYELLSRAATSQQSHSISSQRELHFVFLRRPDRFLHSGDNSGQITGVRFEKTVLEGDESGKQSAVGTGKFEDLECGLVLKSIGYKSVSVDGLSFDHRRGVVPNIRGRVLSNMSADPGVLEKGLYVSGWLKRGPTGIIATNLYCAEETVVSISEDLELGLLTSPSSPKPGREGLLQLLGSKGVKFVPFSGWEKIDSHEQSLGSLINKPREKLSTWHELLDVAN